ncbi:MAG: hypothetical protein AABZ73_02955 [Pseudomonadota bacterium]|uniref:hypothetical protein n=1 Tax=Sphingobium sp. TaxID=1912891 RepID=UPI002E1ABA73
MRAELLGQIVGARFALEAALTELARSGGNVAGVQNQAQALAQLQRNIGSASLADLAAMRGEIAAAVTQTHAVIEQGRAAQGPDATDDAALASLSSRAQVQATSFMRDLHQYDGLLQFDNAEQERAYRQRGEDYRKRYEAGMAQGTPEGALQASGAAYAQAVDLAAHGGSADPALMRRVDELAASTAALRARMIRDGKDVSRFDADMCADLRAIMKSKGKTDAEIDALLAAHPDNPIDAMKAFVADQAGTVTAKDVATLENKMKENAAPTAAQDIKPQSALPLSSSDILAASLGDVGAELKALGVGIAEHDSNVAPTHGVAAHVAKGDNKTAALS